MLGPLVGRFREGLVRSGNCLHRNLIRSIRLVTFGKVSGYWQQVRVIFGGKPVCPCPRSTGFGIDCRADLQSRWGSFRPALGGFVTDSGLDYLHGSCDNTAFPDSFFPKTARYTYAPSLHGAEVFRELVALKECVEIRNRTMMEHRSAPPFGSHRYKSCCLGLVRASGMTLNLITKQSYSHFKCSITLRRLVRSPGLVRLFQLPILPWARAPRQDRRQILREQVPFDLPDSGSGT